MAQPPIEDHGIIGDLHTAALVARDGTIDFLCFPRFDSPSVFAALLDEKAGGSFSIAPSFDHARTRQLYLPDSNILLTRFLSSDGVVEISDLMPVEKACGKAHDLVRRVKVVRGEARVSLRCDPRFDYGRAKRETTRAGNDVIFRSLGPDGTVLRLQGTVPLSVDADGAARAELVLRTNEHAAFVLDDALVHSHGTEGLERFVSTTFKRTLNFWRGWIGGCTYQGRWRETVRRSALTLKLLTSYEFGSLVAAPTFGLPEAIGGARNWDYRYTWIRDAAFTLDALQQIGFLEETTAFMEWVKGRVVAGASPLQILYGLDGRTSVPEIELAHFSGYAGSRPVRIGNAAVDQLQLDIYGELIDAFDRYLSAGGSLSHEQWQILGRLAAWVCDHWRTPDQGLWESRGPPGEFLHSRVMCWVALARMLRIAQRRSLPAPVARWTSVRDEIHGDIHQRFWNPERNAFVLSPGTSVIDASCLRLPLVGFIDATDARWKGTMRAVQEDLVVDSLVQRYRLDGAFWDGVGGPEGSFPMCTLWYAQCLARAGDVQQARYVFEKLLGYANHLGLFAEEIGMTGEQLGNFPQAFTHLALISAACDLDRRIDAAER